MSKPSIICVDDEKIVLDSLKEQLNSEFGSEYNIETAESGREALSLFQDLLQNNREVPLIISDYIMPGMNGDILLKYVRNLNPKVVSILLTGQATIEGIANTVNYGGVFRYIAKPWGIDELYSIITEALKYYYGERLYAEKIKRLKMINTELRKALAEKTNQRNFNPQTPPYYNQSALPEQPAVAISQILNNLLLTIKSGIDIIHIQKRNPAEPDPIYSISVNEFYSVTSDILGDLAETFHQNLPDYLSDNVSEPVNHNISSINRHFSESLQDLTRRIDTIEQQFTKNIDRIAVWEDEEIVILNLSEVLFFTSEDNKTYAITIKSKYKMRDTLDILETKLTDKNFFRCHRGFIINLRHITKISPWFGKNSFITRFEGLPYEIPISRNRVKEMKQLLEI